MEAGRELDALVATKVMGYRLNACHGNRYWVDSEGEEPGHAHDYSTSIAAAWAVVERLDAQNFDVTVTTMPKFEPGCRIAPRGEFNTPRVSFMTAQRVPHAICLAALKAVGAL